MQLAVQLAPSSSTYMGLAESDEGSGNRALAIENYREAVKRDSRNIVAKQRLDEFAPAGPLPR
jgi:hypothetical protein